MLTANVAMLYRPTMAQTLRTLPMALSAVCLNAAGLDAVRASGVLGKLVAAVFDVDSGAVPGSRRGVAAFGAQLEELVRHHPPLKPDVIEAIVAAVHRVLAAPDVSPANAGAVVGGHDAGLSISEHVNRLLQVRRDWCQSMCSLRGN